jgi:hypothetical protein
LARPGIVRSSRVDDVVQVPNGIAIVGPDFHADQPRLPGAHSQVQPLADHHAQAAEAQPQVQDRPRPQVNIDCASDGIAAYDPIGISAPRTAQRPCHRRVNSCSYCASASQSRIAQPLSDPRQRGQRPTVGVAE